VDTDAFLIPKTRQLLIRKHDKPLFVAAMCMGIQIVRFNPRLTHPQNNQPDNGELDSTVSQIRLSRRF